MAFYEKINTFLTAALDTLYPDSCAFCGTASKSPFCSVCREKIITTGGERANFSSLFDLGDVYCYGKYTGILKSAFVDYKFHGKIWLGRRFGEMLYDAFSDILKNKGYDFIVYVPISKNGFKNRGFDQCKEIAEVISKKSNIPIETLIECSSLKVQQVTLTRSDRTKNVVGKFCPKDKLDFETCVKGKRILLFDDILTTGSTLKECGQLFVDAGAEIVDAMVFATGRADIINENKQV